MQSAKFWKVLLGHLASLSRPVPNGQLRMRALQLALSRGWDFRDEDILVPLDPPSRDDLRWWCTDGRLEEGISLALRSPDQMFWSDASNLGWGGHCRRPVCFRCLAGGRGLSINQRELLAVERGLRALCTFLEGRVVAVFSDNTTAVVYLRRQGGTLSPAQKRGSPAHSVLGGGVEHHPDASVCSREEQCSGGRSVSPQPGSRLGVDAPSGCVQLAPPALAGDNQSVCVLTQSPLFCLFCASVGSHGCGYGCHAPVMGFATGICLPSLRHDRSGPGEGEVLSGSGADTHSFNLVPASVVSGAAGAADSAPASISMGSSASATRQKIPSKPVHASSSCVESLRRFVRASFFSRSVARRLGQARRQSSVANYQSKWLTYWCRSLRFRRLQITLFGSGRIKACLCLRSRPTALCCRQFFSSSFLRLVRTECFKTFFHRETSSSSGSTFLGLGYGAPAPHVFGV